MDVIHSEKFERTMLYLYKRWRDEREHEDWSDYAEAMRLLAEDNGLNFIKAVKMPFGFEALQDGTKIRLFVKMVDKRKAIKLFAKIY